MVLAVRLWPGRTRRAAVPPHPGAITDTTVSVIVATLDEAARLAPCLAGLRAQGQPLLEVLVVDSRSTDGTRELVAAAAALDPRVRLLTDDPLPAGWVGKVWALEHGLRAARGEWVLGIDADVEPRQGLVAGVVTAAREAKYSVVSFSPRFAAQTGWEQLVQPALLLTLVLSRRSGGKRHGSRAHAGQRPVLPCPARRAAPPRRLLAGPRLLRRRRDARASSRAPRGARRISRRAPDCIWCGRIARLARCGESGGARSIFARRRARRDSGWTWHS